LVIFAAESFTQCPLTIDHKVVQNLLKDIESGMLEDGTAIGMGLATAAQRLKESKAKSKVIILLTDGVNNTGRIDPYTAAEISKKYDIRVYTIGVGSKGTAPYPVETPFGKQYREMEVKIDEPLLQRISQETNGKYFRATDKQKLKNIYEEIDQLEKTELEVQEYHKYSERFYGFAFIGGLLFLLELVSRYTIFRNLP
jgi:Ca-activated chloride channel family protein